MSNTELDAVRLSVLATVKELQEGHRLLGLPPDPEDREAYDIICRIERKMLGVMANE